MADQHPSCAVIIPNYNGGSLTAACLDALLADPPAGCSWSVVVVDDGSTEDTRAALASYLPHIQLVEQDNTGFAGACNAGAAAAGAVDYLVFLNNDTVPMAGWLDALVNEARADEQVAAVGAKLLYPNGQIQHAGVVIHQNGLPYHVYAGFDGNHPAVNTSRDVTAATAACLLVRRTDFELVDGFDTAFLNSYEDVDLCLRLRERGARIRYCPLSVVIHLESVTRFPTGAATGLATSERLYDQRWRERVVPDDVKRYLEDGLLSFSWSPWCPLTVSVSPELAVIHQDAERLAQIEQLLQERSEQVFDLLAAQTRRQLNDRAGLLRPSLARTTPARVNRVVDGREHRLGSGQGELISILLPVKNGAGPLSKLLPALLSQEISARLEIVAVDSGSEDDTIGVLKRFGATILAIAPTDFDHGLTRNLLAEEARGNILVFLSQVAVPADPRWLAPLVNTVIADPRVAGVCSRVVGSPDADILTRRAVALDLSGSPARRRMQIDDWAAYEAQSPEARRRFLNFHTVSAAIRAEALQRTPFRSVKTLGEDLLWARELVESGWALVHEPASSVYHSHPYTLRELLGRNVDDGIANRDILHRRLGSEEVVATIRSLVNDDWSYLSEELGLMGSELTDWQVESVLRRATQIIGQWLGSNYETLPEGMAAFFSGVAQVRGAADGTQEDRG